MNLPRHMERDGYHALDWQGEVNISMREIWQSFPELVVGRYLVNTAFDSGLLVLSESQRHSGWRMVGRHAHSPPVQDTGDIPHDQFDEWLVFDYPAEVECFESMVNYYQFTPIDFSWDEKRERFWEQVIRLQPLHVLGENDGVYLVSRDEILVRKLLVT